MCDKMLPLHESLTINVFPQDMCSKFSQGAFVVLRKKNAIYPIKEDQPTTSL